MICLEVRERLPESALGVLPGEESTEVDRHLAWCAGCRKESAELGSAAQSLAFAIRPVDPPRGLEARVVERVRSAASGPSRRRRGSMVAAAIVAAIVGISGLGWGAVMAGRAERFAERAKRAEATKLLQLEQFRHILEGVAPATRLSTDQTHLTQLAPPPMADGVGGGAALELISPTTLDFVIVRVAGLDPKDAQALPYRVTVANGQGRVLPVGKITALDPNDGSADVYHDYNLDLTGFTDVRVTDARGKVVLRGTIDQRV